MGDILTTTFVRSRVPVRDLVQLTDVDRENQINDTTLEAQITAAESDIKPFLIRRGRDSDELIASPPPKLKELLFRWWEWVAHGDRHSLTDDIKDRHREDLDFLEAYANGEGTLGDDDDPATHGASGRQSSDDRVFDRDKMEGW